MNKTAKFILIVIVVVSALGVGLIASAQDATTDTTATDQEITAQDLGISNQTLLPNSPFYFLKEWGRGIQSFFAFGNLKKAELQQKFANEKLIELKKLVDEGKVSSDILEKATEKYEKTMEKIKERTDKIKEKTSENEDVNKFLEKFTNQQVLHEKILEKLEGKVPADVLEKIKGAREQHLEKFKEVMQKLETNKEKIAEKIQNALQNGDESNPQILEKIREKMPDDVKESLDKIKEKVTEKVIERIEKQNEKRACPQITTVDPATFCPNGKIQSKKDENGCIVSLNCVPLEIKACPMDAKECPDGSFVSRTGPNCEFAKCPEQKNECKTDEDCPQPNCSATPTANCVGQKTECINGKCKVVNVTDTCKTLWWYDNTHKDCQQKQFCGAYMYFGLKTFEEKEDCEKNLIKEYPTMCQTNSDCIINICAQKACINKNYKTPQESGCAFPPNMRATSCKCENNKCVGY